MGIIMFVPPFRGRRRFPGPAGVMMGKRSLPHDHESVAVRRTDFSSKSKSPRYVMNEIVVVSDSPANKIS